MGDGGSSDEHDLPVTLEELNMSLKAFHIVFVTVTTVTSLFVSGVGFVKYFGVSGGANVDLALGVGGLFFAAALLVYGRYVLKKLQHISYL